MPSSRARHESLHRARAVGDLGSHLAVTAGAGAGKTSVLVDRFVNIARQEGLGPDRILAITFTRKAAVEMKERAIRAFEAAGDTHRRRATEAAYISTIHGFAERVLRERAFEAGVDPAFQVLTEYDKKVFLEAAVQEMYARPALRRYAPRLKKEFSGGWRLFSIVDEVARMLREGPATARAEFELHADEEACIGLAMERLRAHVAASGRAMLDCMTRLRPLLAGANFTSRKAMWEAAQRYLAAVDQCVAAGSVAAAGGDTWRETRFTGQISADERTAIRQELDAIKGLAGVATFSDWQAQERLEREVYPLKREIYAAAAGISERYAAHKRATGALDFHDLQLRALELLEGSPAIQREYAERFRHVLLDESQDTDELQYRLINAVRMPGSVMFMVGDPKQCIYEFRGANPDVFSGAVASLPEADRLQLAENFRSRPEVVAFINGLGHALLPDMFATIDGQADYGGQRLGGPGVTSILSIRDVLPDGDGRQVEDLSVARQREADAVAEEVVRLMQAGTMVRDREHRDSVQWTPLRPRHVAMLFRSRTAIPYFERALADRGVPYVTAAGSGFYDRAEVLDAMMLLRVVEQPLDDLALAAVLRSPFCGAGDEDLLALRAAGGQGAALYEPLGRHEPLAAFHDAFRELRRATRALPAADVLDAAIDRFGYEAAIAAHADGRAMLANLAKLRRQVRDLGAVSAGEAYRELQRARALLDRESQAPLVGTDDDVVVLTTIHDAKGLEWPVVCLPNLQSASKGASPGFSARHGALLLEAIDAAGEAQPLLSLAAIQQEIRARGEAEERRLLYVALTRARERLILSASVKEADLEPREPRAFAAPLPFLLHHAGEALGVPGDHADEACATRVVHVRGDVPRTTYESGDPLARTFTPVVVAQPAPEPALPRALPVSVKVTELLSYRRCPQVYRFAHSLEIDEHLPRRAAVRDPGAVDTGRLSPVELGTAVHALLERARFDAPDIAAEIARLVEGRPAAQQARMREMLEPVLGGDVGTLVRTAQRAEREWPFAVRIGGVLVEGVIDLALQHADGSWTIVDYKSNDFSRSGRLEYLRDYYQPQLELYAAAVARAGLGPVTECALVFLNGPVVHRWHVAGSLAQVEQWATETIGHIARRDYATHAGPKCEMCGYRKRKVCAIGQEWPGTAAPRTDIVSARD